jgi:hypothetical protein
MDDRNYCWVYIFVTSIIVLMIHVQQILLNFFLKKIIERIQQQPQFEYFRISTIVSKYA